MLIFLYRDANQQESAPEFHRNIDVIAVLTTVVGRVGVDPTTLKRTDLQSAAFADSLPTHIVAPIL